VMTFVEALLTLVFVRLLFRGLMWLARKATGRGKPAVADTALDPH